MKKTNKKEKQIKIKNEKRLKIKKQKVSGKKAKKADNTSIQEQSTFNYFSENVHHSARALWSNIRFSLALRIALHYCWQLFRTALTAILVVSFCFVMALVPTYSQITQEYEQVFVHEGQEAFFLEASNDTRLEGAYFTPMYRLSNEETALFQRIITYTFPKPLLSAMVLTLPILLEDGSGLMIISFQISHIFQLYIAVILGIIISDVLRIFSFIRKRKNLNKTVLKPLREISDMAATLSASNLSDRINTEGTKNELKDLSVTINHMLDRIERSYNSQKQFVSDASHELRTPIAVMQGYVQMLNRWGKNDKEILDEGLEAIAQETESMKDLVENLLFLARHDKKTLLLEMEVFDPCELVSTIHRENLLVAPDHQYIFSPQDHCTIYGDKNMIKQALRILVDNAIKYSPSGSNIQLGIEKTPQWCILSVTDSGNGMTKEEMKHIFNRFYRSDTARSSRSSGHGLGLSIARIIVNAHQGMIKVKSKPQEGSTFSLLLPYSLKL